MLYLILGGARSGKSSLAEELALKIGGQDVYYLATARAGDKEMKDRIIKHREERPSQWTTIEEDLNLAGVISSLPPSSVILLDCITMLVSNLLHEGEKEIINEMKNIIEAGKDKDLILVSNEVGMGIVPQGKLTRDYRDILGRVNQLLARKSDKVYFTIAGLPVELKELRAELSGELDLKRRKNNNEY